MRALWGFCKWIGRLCWWVVFWPIGLWRSYRHGARKRADRIERAVRLQRQPAVPPHWRAGYLPIPPPPPPLPPNPQRPWPIEDPLG